MYLNLKSSLKTLRHTNAVLLDKQELKVEIPYWMSQVDSTLLNKGLGNTTLSRIHTMKQQQ